MSDSHEWQPGDPFAPDAVEDAIARSLRADAPATPIATLVRTLSDAYALPPAADAVLASSRATLARRAAALADGTVEPGGMQVIVTESRPLPVPYGARPPQPPRRRRGPLPPFWRTAAAVLIVALLSASFLVLLHQAPRPGGHPTPTPGLPTPTTADAPQPPAPAGVYAIAPEGLFRLDLSTGAIQQQHPLTASGQQSAGTPIVANGILYYTSYTAPRFAITAVSATTGAQLWRTPTPIQVVQLALADGTLYGSAVNGTVTGSDVFYALRARDGQVLWTFPTASFRGLASIAGGVVYLANQPQGTLAQHIHALRASDGASLWDVALPADCGGASDEAIDRGTVFVSCGVQYPNSQSGSDVVYALRASDGGVLWRSGSAGHPSVAAAGGGLVYVLLGGKNAAGVIMTGLVALDETSGAVRWQAPNVTGWPVLAGSTVYALVAKDATFTAPEGDNLMAFAAADGRVLWTYSEANHRIELGPVVAGGVVYQALDGQIVALAAADGSARWRSPTLDAQAGVLGMAVVTGG